MHRNDINLTEVIDITSSPEAAGVIVTYDRGDARATDRLTMHADGMLYQYRSTNDGWQLDFVLGRIHPKSNKPFLPPAALRQLEGIARDRYGKHLINVSKDY
jgi:hypothetical protein